MSRVYLAFQNNTAPANTNKTWNDVRLVQNENLPLLDELGAATGWALNMTTIEQTGSYSFTGRPLPTGDNSWVDELIIPNQGIYTDKTTGNIFRISTGQAGVFYDVVIAQFYPDSGRATTFQVNGGAEQIISASPDTPAVFSGIETNALGDIDILFKPAPGATGSCYIDAAYIEQAGPTTSLTLTSPPQLGAVLSGTGSSYAAQPTGPISITQGTRSLPDMPITVSAWDAATGSFNWTTNAALPGFPANGADATPFVLTLEGVDIELPEPVV